MPKKDLIPRSLTDSIPSLVIHFQKATRKVFSMDIYVHKKTYGKFRVFEDDLREKGVSSREYADTVVKMMEKWVHGKCWKCLPLNVFMSDWVLEKFMKIHNSATVTIKTNDVDILIQDEVMVARTYIAHALEYDSMKFCDVVEELKPMLSTDWLFLYYKKHGRPIKKSLEILSEEYGVTGARTYNDIIGAI